MRLVTFSTNDEPDRMRLGVWHGDEVHEAAELLGSRAEAPADMPALLAGLDQLRPHLEEGLQRAGSGRPIDQVRLRAPIPRPRKNVFCVGKNYLEHVQEGQRSPHAAAASGVPEVPVFFTKPPTAVIGPGDAILHHAVVEALDYEVELAVVIGRRGRDIAPEQALEYVAGYTIVNDVTDRILQRRHGQWVKGKGLDTFCPMGPCIVTRDEAGDWRDLTLRLHVNGELRQSARAGEMIFSVPRLIAELSRGLTLEPGDVIATGTCAGCGFAFDPPRYLRSGDVVRCEIDGIGVLENEVRAP